MRFSWSWGKKWSDRKYNKIDKHNDKGVEYTQMSFSANYLMGKWRGELLPSHTWQYFTEDIEITLNKCIGKIFQFM
jgi:hypothetical protein